tara:strand:+ start:68 stop:1096 length:1029 start_codon:yes stop_codon:yes gene_type:complete
MSRIRLNSEYRNKGGVRFREHLEQENTQEKEAYLQAREQIIPLQKDNWKLAETIVRRHYTDEDVKMAYHLQNKFENVDTIAKDSCFHFGYMAKKEDVADDKHYSNRNQQSDFSQDEGNQDDKYITKHFDFRLDGNTNGNESGKQSDFAYAMFRDELKGRDHCNPDINVEQKWGKGDGEENQSNPHWTKIEQANDKYLGLNNGDHSYAKEWNDDFKLDLIGREYCRDRQIGCKKEEFDTLMIWQVAKQKLIQCHTKWIESILNQMKEIKLGLKGYRYLDEMIELGTELGLTINDAEIIRCNSTGLVIYNPKNLADRVKGMKNKSVSRDQKILARKLYDRQVAN